MRNKINQLLNNILFEKTILLLICLSLIIFILDSINSFHNVFNVYIRKFEVFTIFVFTVEYILRVYTCKKITELFKPIMVIDFLAVAPFYLSFCSINTIFLRILRYSMLIRILKINRYSQALDNIISAFKSKKEELMITFSIFGVGILLSAILMYLTEYEAQPSNFSSIPKSLYFSIITFTTIGYGDVTPITTAGKVISCISAIFGVGLHGLFIGIIGTAFISAFKKESV